MSISISRRNLPFSSNPRRPVNWLDTLYLRSIDRTPSKPYYQPGMESAADIERLYSEDPDTAERAFIQLQPRIEGYLNRYLRTWLPIEAEREDVIATTVLRIWEGRRIFHFKGAAAWWVYVATIARRCAIDQFDRLRTVPLDIEIPAKELELIQGFIDLTADRRAMYRAADEVWLKRDPRVDDREMNRRVLAAELYFLHRQPWKEVARAVRLRPDERERLDDWLSDTGALLLAAFNELCWENELLCAELLDLPETNWSADERRVIEWRYGYGFLTEKLLRMAPGFSRSFVEETFRKCQPLLPFMAAAEAVRRGFSKAPTVSPRLAEPDFWKRVAFQYHAKCELPQKQILERAQSPAEFLGYRLTDGILNVWLSNGRLAAQLATYVKAGLAQEVAQ